MPILESMYASISRRVAKDGGSNLKGGREGGGGGWETILSEHQGICKPTDSDESDIVHRPHYLILPKLKHFWNVLGGRKNLNILK